MALSLQGRLNAALSAMPLSLQDPSTRQWFNNVFSIIGSDVDDIPTTPGTGDILADGSIPFDGQETFNAGIKANTVDEVSAATGVTGDGVLLKDACVTVGTASSVDGSVTFKNSAGSATVVVNSTAAKNLKIDNTGHDVIIGINGAAGAGLALKVTGAGQFTNTLTVVAGSLIVPVYADATARDAAITSPLDGMIVKLATGKFTGYDADATSWDDLN